MQKSPWWAGVAAAALLTLPVATYAQSQSTSAQAQSPSQPPVDAAAAKAHLSQARDTLSQLTSLPEAAKLQGDTRTQVSQLISNFNALITTQADWHASYAKVDETLTSLLGPAAAGDQPVGTSGSTALDPAVRAKLEEFRTHLKAFESAAGGAASASGSMPPAAPTPATSNPANPATPATSATNPPTSASNPPSSATSAAPPTATEPPPAAATSSGTNAAVSADAQRELNAISAIIAESKTGALTKEQTTDLKKHVEALRALLVQR